MSTSATLMKSDDSSIPSFPGKNSILDRLDKITLDSANAIRNYIVSADIDSYNNFLNMMYYYTLESEKKLKLAASVCPDKALKDYYNEQSEEEKGHYMLALKDLEAMGYLINHNKPREVEAYDTFWYSVGEDNCTSFVGSSYVFENVGQYLAKEVLALITRLKLNKKQSRWLMVHLEADIEHGKEAQKMAEYCLSIDSGSMIEGAQTASKLWIEIFQAAFRRRVALPVII